MNGLKKIRNKKERIVYELLKKKFPNDEILYQYRFDIPYKFKRLWIERHCGIHKHWFTVSVKRIHADFFNKTKNIIIEVDNIGHSGAGEQRQDKARDEKLIEAGYKVIRIKYDIGFIEGVKKILKKTK